jgi:methionyl-tRNA formyltransferase
VAADCDVVVRFGFGLLEGPILTAPEYGVLSTHGSDIREYRGMGPKVSFVEGDDSASVTLQQLTDEIDGGRIVEVASRDLPSPHTLDDVLGAVHELQAGIYATGIDKLREASFEPVEPESLGSYYGHDLQQRDPGFVARLLLRNNRRRLAKLLDRPD